jgi:thiaminase/transcriptional activator TenA
LCFADLVVFQARLVARSPRSAQGVLAQGVVGLVAELDWFDIQAASVGVSLEVAPMRATRDYQALLSELDEERYTRAVVGLWYDAA